ncbi:MAG: hypothetical protein GAK35_01057 [Herbaspirillum frisingense]|uniref:Endonuclease n=1 Tax=Herbaspirillum frisingense TaxID=92645 RepID=A0A7V8FYR3_9BURK|nr:MAG: hypothetical protein GAK35_01057 [Herbaspirillum frisingense]
MKLHELIQGTPEWDAFRLNHNGASEAAAMLGLSKNVTRNELLQAKHTKEGKQFSDWVRTHILDHGHAVEAKARPLIEEIIGEDLYAVTCSNEDEGRKESASCDGLTLNYDIGFEHKQWNAELAASVRAKILPDEHQPQVQQNLMITGAEKWIFAVSDGTPDNLVYMEVLPDAAWFERILAGWDQFERDLAEYTPPVEAPEVVGRAPNALPALRLEVQGQVTASNLTEFRAHAVAYFENIKTDLQTDQDFADADRTTKWCQEVEDRLERAKEGALAQTTSIEELFRTMDDLKEMARQKRLTLEKLVTNRKQAIRGERVTAAQKALDEHLAALQAEVKGITLRQPPADFYAAIKGLRTVASVQNAVDTTLANAKIAADAHAKDIRAKLAWIEENAADHRDLLADLPILAAKPLEDFTLTITTRIERSKAAAQKRLDEAKAAETAAPAAAPAGPPSLRLGEIQERLTPISITADGLATIGFRPADIIKSAKMYHEHDFPAICAALTQVIQAAQATHGGAARAAAPTTAHQETAPMARTTAPASYEEGPCAPIPLTKVDSGQVQAIGYDADTKTLAVTFTRGSAIYHYPNVEPELHEQFLAAESIGTFFGTHIKELPFKKYRGPVDQAA